jgi:hypothetical protein
MQWQHGTVEETSNGTLTLTPFAVDGRQLLSVPCNATHSSYTRYNQSETIKVGQMFDCLKYSWTHNLVGICCLHGSIQAHYSP